MNCMQNNCTFGEKEMMHDCLDTEKYLIGMYNASLTEAATPEVVQTLTDLLADTYRMQQQLFREMNSRGWYPVTKAEEQKITQAKQKFGASVCAK